MAYELIKTYSYPVYEQEELLETNLVAGEDGVVTEVTTVKQQYLKIWTEVKLYQDRISAENKSDFNIESWSYAEVGEKGNSEVVLSLETELYATDAYIDGVNNRYYQRLNKIKLQAGNNYSWRLNKIALYNLDEYDYYVADRKVTDFTTYHNFNGDFEYFYGRLYGIGASSIAFNVIRSESNYAIHNLLIDGESVSIGIKTSGTKEYDPSAYILPINRGLAPITADNFNDEQNPSFSYKVEPGLSTVFTKTNSLYNARDIITDLQASLSFDGETAVIPFRDVPLDNSRYVFELTDAERETLRQKAQGSDTVPIYYLIKTTRKLDATDPSYKYPGYDMQQALFTNSAQRTLTIVGAEPTLNPVIRDVQSDTIALTGNENTFVLNESMVEFITGATASKGASIVSQSVQCGSKVVTDLYNGVIDDVESGRFVFTATDSRGLSVTAVTENFNVIHYIKPTVTQEVAIEISGETGAIVIVKASGNYYNGSFGAADNELVVEARYKVGNGEYGSWVRLAGASTYAEEEYNITGTFTGLDYSKTYTFQTRATDKLNTAISSSYTIKMIPVFDWSEKDFNFNVPINMNADKFSMHNKTIIRHSPDTKNTVLSADSGHIYLRPGGTNSTYGESIIYPDGSIKLGGVVDFTKSFTINNNYLNDFVIDSGTTSMGSNGTWYWQKWASGKSEAWGCRNFGRAAINTAWGNLYRSEIFTQELPDDVFITTPDVININLVNISNGAWIVKHENTAPSAVTTGSFIIVRPASATATISYVGFHIIGLWKQ